MKKIGINIISLFIIFLCMVTFSKNNVVSVATVGSNKSIVSVVTPAANDKCNTLFGDPADHTAPAYWMQWVLNVMKYVAIAALLLLSIADFFKGFVSNDKDAIKKATGTVAKRFIYCVLIFFLPIIVDFLMTLFGAYGTCGVG